MKFKDKKGKDEVKERLKPCKDEGMEVRDLVNSERDGESRGIFACSYTCYCIVNYNSFQIPPKRLCNRHHMESLLDHNIAP